ncbi:TIGR01244 family sulfur transferase [Nitratireductor basaltis]|nr:TIGR01244 family sulfur transferase [Nitratireductor basaltis]
MQARFLDEDFAVAPQIAAAHVEAIAEAGFKSIVCNRPDSEDGAVPHDEVQAAAEAAGLEFRFLPVVPGEITEDDARNMAALLNELPKPVLAYCRSGGRCTNLYAMVQQTSA